MHCRMSDDVRNVPEIIKYVCGSWRQMAGSKTECNLEPERARLWAHSAQIGKGVVPGGESQQQDLVDPFVGPGELFQVSERSQDNKLHRVQLLKDVFLMQSL